MHVNNLSLPPSLSVVMGNTDGYKVGNNTLNLKQEKLKPCGT